MPRGLPRSGLEASHAAGSGVAATGVDGLTDPRAKQLELGRRKIRTSLQSEVPDGCVPG